MKCDRVEYTEKREKRAIAIKVSTAMVTMSDCILYLIFFC